MFSTVAAAPPTGHGGSLFSASSPARVISCLFANSCPDGCEAVSHRGFDLPFPGISEAEHLFTRALAACMCSLKKCPFSFSASF